MRPFSEVLAHHIANALWLAHERLGRDAIRALRLQRYDRCDRLIIVTYDFLHASPSDRVGWMASTWEPE